MYLNSFRKIWVSFDAFETISRHLDAFRYSRINLDALSMYLCYVLCIYDFLSKLIYFGVLGFTSMNVNVFECIHVCLELFGRILIILDVTGCI